MPRHCWKVLAALAAISAPAAAQEGGGGQFPADTLFAMCQQMRVDELANMGCLTYVRAAIDTMTLQPGYHETICIPQLEGVEWTPELLALLFLAYVDEHPDLRPAPAAFALAEMLRAHFPCALIVN